METTVKKTQTAVGRKYSYKYADIAAVHEYLESKGFSYYQITDRVGDDDYIFTIPIIDGKELPPRRGCKIVNATLREDSNPAQEQGSAITYARRYSLLMAFGLATEDDDAQSLTVEKKATEKQIAYLKMVYQGENLKKLLDTNGIKDITELSINKASELIEKLKEAQNGKQQNGNGAGSNVQQSYYSR